MPIIVDGFHYAASELSRVYFLTHMHADHYGGLTRSWDCGLIYGTEPTLRLIGSQFLRPLPLNTPTHITVGGAPVVVTMLDANHCPGAACVLFEMVDGSLTLHVGDFRWDRETMLQMNPVLRALQLDCLYLDTTYCDARYTFPPQRQVIDATVAAVSQHLRGSAHASTLILFGAYSLGKERLYLEVARRLGKRVFVDKARHQTLLCLRWPPETMQLLTTDQSSTPLWVVPISHIKFPAMRTHAASRKALQSDFKCVVGIQPTGWTFGGARGGGGGGSAAALLSCRRQGADVIYGAPYSEHSSFTELVDCVRYLRPRRVVPTVNCGTAEKARAQVALLTSAAAQPLLSDAARPSVSAAGGAGSAQPLSGGIVEA
ncbi:beta-lactamase-like protein [Tribonema minus]|uniref:Beta-lactamase-like protein n=1 Tax=Tribonema minus TaxID=303371 RepID=A0A835Z828_9STRA|nr:beta-lactamase-like protein [Tribonema minus]